MEDIHDVPEDSFNKAPVVNILNCTENEICTQNLIQLTQLQNTVLSETNNVTGESYINLSDSQNILHSDGDTFVEAPQIQFLVIQGQEEDPLSTQLPTESTRENTEDVSTDISRKQGKDTLICGICQKVCHNILQLLDHKASHIGPGLGLGCEVCSLTFSRTKTLTDHYRRKHKIHLVETGKKRRKHDGVGRKSSHRKHKPSEIHLSNGDQPVIDSKEKVLEELKAIHHEMNHCDEEKLDVSPEATIEGHLNGFEFKGIENKKEKKQNGSFGNNTQSQTLTSWSSCSKDLLDKVTPDTQNLNVKSVGNPEQIQMTEMSSLDCTVAMSEDFIESNSQTENIVSTVTDNVYIVTNDGERADAHKFSDKSPGSEKENTEIDLESVCHSTANVNKEVASRQSGNLSRSTRGKTDITKELDMPDFYFIAVIERGPRNNIKGGKYHFKCLYCDLKMSWRSTMCQHMKDKHNDILQIGPILSTSSPQQHMEKNHRVIKMSDYVKLEKSTKPGKRMRGIETQDLPGEFPCAKCGKVFNRLRYLRKHEVIHQAEKNLLCSVCVKSFKTLANLNQHMRTHKEREAYKCRQCDFESTINIAIHGHRQIHKDGCVLCDICGCAYNDKSTLAKHKKVHDPDRPFACTHPGCTWRFKSKSICNAHVRAHTTKAKFECKICMYAFRQKHHLLRHENKVHNVTSPNKKCTYTVLPMDYVDDGIIVTDGNKLVDLEPKPVQNEVSLIINDNSEVSVDDQYDLETALQSGQLVIATDSAGNTINYEMTDIGMSISYQTLLPDPVGQPMDTQTILIPQTEASQIMYQQEEVTETICTEVSTTTSSASS